MGVDKHLVLGLDNKYRIYLDAGTSQSIFTGIMRHGLFSQVSPLITIQNLMLVNCVCWVISHTSVTPPSFDCIEYHPKYSLNTLRIKCKIYFLNGRKSYV
jgi:hypothetical protein